MFVAVLERAHHVLCRAIIRRPPRSSWAAKRKGSDPLWRQPDMQAVSVPMFGHADSLNVSVTAAILLYEVVRQRNAGS